MYITTPIYYASGRLHLGHTYTTVMGDALKKYYSSIGEKTFFLTGSDEHGSKIEKKANEENLLPKEYVDKVVKEFQGLWKLLEIDYDEFIRTTDKKHIVYVQNVFKKMLNNDDIYLGEYSGTYCVSCESYITSSDGNLCPDCNGKLEVMTEECYFFRCHKYQKLLEEHFKKNPDFLVPLSRKNELFNSFFKEGIKDLAISRKNIKWGIPTSTDDNHVIYVWLDALFNYKSAIDNEAYWPADIHIVGKEITRFHAIYWPMFLMALDEPLPKQIVSHGWLLMDETKMSKSKGNVIYAETIIKKYGTDALRFYLLKEMKPGSDGNFSSKLFLEMYNAMLVNEFSNLISRTRSMTLKFLNGTVENIGEDRDAEYYSGLQRIDQKLFASIKDYNFPEYIENIWNLVRHSNKYIDIKEPWLLGKKDDKADITIVLCSLWKLINVIVEKLYPIMPSTAVKIKKMYKISTESITMTDEYENLFMRLDLEIEIKELEEEILKEYKTAMKRINND